MPLIQQSLNLSGGYGCRTLQAGSAPAISPDAYLELTLGVSFSAGQWANAYPEGTISLGRVTTTYSP